MRSLILLTMGLTVALAAEEKYAPKTIVDLPYVAITYLDNLGKAEPGQTKSSHMITGWFDMSTLMFYPCKEPSKPYTLHPLRIKCYVMQDTVPKDVMDTLNGRSR